MRLSRCSIAYWLTFTRLAYKVQTHRYTIIHENSVSILLKVILCNKDCIITYEAALR